MSDDRHTWGSLLSVQEFAALTGVGFAPVGHVTGTAVFHLGYVTRTGRCSGTWSYTGRTELASERGGPFGALLRKQYGVRRLALARAIEECAALGGDGIVGTSVEIRPFRAGGTEIAVRATAIRARTAIRPGAPFSSHLSAQEFAVLLRSGWMPTALLFGISLAARHDDARTRRQTRRWVVDREVSGYSYLVRDARRDARRQLEQAVRAHGGEGVVVDAMTLGIGARDCPTVPGQHDHLAEATILGTSIVSFGRPPHAEPRGPLSVLHLGTPAAAPHALRVPEAPDGPAAGRIAAVVPAEGGLLDRVTARAAAAHHSRSILNASDPAATSKRPRLKRR